MTHPPYLDTLVLLVELLRFATPGDARPKVSSPFPRAGRLCVSAGNRRAVDRGLRVLLVLGDAVLLEGLPQVRELGQLLLDDALGDVLLGLRAGPLDPEVGRSLLLEVVELVQVLLLEGGRRLVVRLERPGWASLALPLSSLFLFGALSY
jgi:hypothetical protein